MDSRAREESSLFIAFSFEIKYYDTLFVNLFPVLSKNGHWVYKRFLPYEFKTNKEKINLHFTKIHFI